MGAQGGHRVVVELLVSANANVEAQEEDGLRPLHFAAGADSQEACLLLLEACADPGARDDEGRNALAHVPLQSLSTRVERQSWESLFETRRIERPESCSKGEVSSPKSQAGASALAGMRDLGTGDTAQ